MVMIPPTIDMMLPSPDRDSMLEITEPIAVSATEINIIWIAE